MLKSIGTGQFFLRSFMANILEVKAYHLENFSIVAVAKWMDNKLLDILFWIISIN